MSPQESCAPVIGRGWRRRLNRMATLAHANEVYLVPRNGTLESVNVGDHDDLRKLRTELEILRRIARSVTALRLTPPQANTEDTELHQELYNALNDATNPVVEEVVALIDTQNPDLRKELFMSVVNEEAENIVQEAIESGVATPTETTTVEKPESAVVEEAPNSPAEQVPPVETNQDTPVNEVAAADLPVEEALAQAQEELTKAVESAQADDVATPDQDVSAPGQDETASDDANAEPVAEAITEPETADVDTSEATSEIDNANELEQDEIDCHDATADLEAQLDACLSAEADATPDEPTDPEPFASNATEESFVDLPPTMASNHSSPQEYTADKATAAVEEIERGIRKLADVLNNDVSTQWKQAQDAFGQVMEARTKAGAMHQEVTQMTREIARLKEEIEIARDDADVARRETKLMREDALQAKHRAEDLANAAQQYATEM